MRMPSISNVEMTGQAESIATLRNAECSALLPIRQVHLFRECPAQTIDVWRMDGAVACTYHGCHG